MPRLRLCGLTLNNPFTPPVAKVIENGWQRQGKLLKAVLQDHFGVGRDKVAALKGVEVKVCAECGQDLDNDGMAMPCWTTKEDADCTLTIVYGRNQHRN